MSFKNSLKHRIFRRLTTSEMIIASARYEIHTTTEAKNDHSPAEIHSNYELETPATERNNNTKDLKELKKNNTSTSKLKPVLNLMDLVVFGICQVIGSGIYVLAGTAGKDFAGSGLFISFIIGAISAGSSAICYAEFASRIPVIGGSYMYTYYSSGEMLGFLSGFLTFLRGFVALAGNGVAWTGYFKSFLSSLDKDVNKDNWISYLFGHTLTNNSSIISDINLLAPVIILILAIISAYGIKTSANFMSVVATWNVSLILFFILIGIYLFDINVFINPCDYIEFGNECKYDVNKDAFLPYGIEGVFAAGGLAFWSYVGLEGIASVAEESVNPKRDIPRAIYIVLVIVSILYLAVAVILLGMVPFQSLDEDAPLAEAFAIHDEILVQQIASFGAVSTITVVIFATLINRPRSLYRISLDGLLCNVCSYVNGKTQTPMVAIGVTAFLAMIVSILFNITEILQVSSVVALLQYAVVAGGVLIVRYSPPQASEIRPQFTSLWESKKKNPIKYSDGHGWNMSLESSQTVESMGSMASIANMTPMSPSVVVVTSFWSYYKVLTVVWSWIIACLFISFVVVERDEIIEYISKGFWYFCLCIGGTVLCAAFILIVNMHYVIPWKTYVGKKVTKIVWTPLCPYLPLFAVAINSFIIASYRFYVFARIFIGIAIGFIVYFAYGYNHSKLHTKGNSLRLMSDTYGSNDYTHQNENSSTKLDDNEYFSQARALSIRSLSDAGH